MRTRPLSSRIARLGSLGGPSLSPPVAAFSGSPLSVSVGAPNDVLFTDSSANAPTSWLWLYRDSSGTIGDTNWHNFPTNHTSQNPVLDITLISGIVGGISLDIQLTATNAAGSDDEVKLAYLLIEE